MRILSISTRMFRGEACMRNRIAHGYFDINIDVVWDTLKHALPLLLQRLPAIRKDAATQAGRN